MAAGLHEIMAISQRLHLLASDAKGDAQVAFT